MSELRALTIRQPWCSAIAFGQKRVENRTRPVSHRGPLALHAGLGIEWDAPGIAWTAAGLAPYSPGSPRDAWRASLPLGAIIAVAELSGCHLNDPDEECGHSGDWSPGKSGRCSPWGQPDCWHWQLGSVRPLPRPVPARGWMGLWIPTPDTERAVMGQLEASHA